MEGFLNFAAKHLLIFILMRKVIYLDKQENNKLCNNLEVE